MISGAPLTDRASVEATGWDVDTLVHRAAKVYLEMIFRDGLYHADPHPGNFLLPDGQHLAILDFGDVGRVTSQRRRQLESMVIAIGARDVDSLVDVVLEMTTPPPGVDMAELRASIELWLNRYLLVGVGQLDMTAIMSSGMDSSARTSWCCRPTWRYFSGSCCGSRGWAKGRHRGTGDRAVQPYVSQMMAERFDPRRVARQVGRSARSWEHFIAGLPDELQGILEQVRTGRVGVDFRVHDADHAVDRLVDGLVTAASVMAGAELISRRASPMVGPFSVPGLVAVGWGSSPGSGSVPRRRTRASWVTRARQTC